MQIYELKTDDGCVLSYSGENPEHAAERAADTFQVTIVAWRFPMMSVVVAHPNQIKG